MRALVAILLLSTASAAYAQAPTPPFVPLTIDEKSYKDFNEYIDNVPLKYAAPIKNWITGLEQSAVAAKAAADKAAADKQKEQEKKD